MAKCCAILRRSRCVCRPARSLTTPDGSSPCRGAPDPVAPPLFGSPSPRRCVFHASDDSRPRGPVGGRTGFNREETSPNMMGYGVTGARGRGPVGVHKFHPEHQKPHIVMMGPFLGAEQTNKNDARGRKCPYGIPTSDTNSLL